MATLRVLNMNIWDLPYSQDLPLRMGQLCRELENNDVRVGGPGTYFSDVASAPRQVAGPPEADGHAPNGRHPSGSGSRDDAGESSTSSLRLELARSGSAASATSHASGSSSGSRARSTSTAQRGFDIVGFQEAFMEADREKLIAAGRRGGLSYHHFFASGMGFPAYPVGGQSSGLLVLSRYPIVQVSYLRYSLNGKPHRMLHWDWQIGKGCGLARVSTPFGLVDVFVSHFVASYAASPELPDEYLSDRVAQAYECAEFIQSSRRAPLALLLCDLNSTPDSLPYKVLTSLAGLHDAYAVTHAADGDSDSEVDVDVGGHTCNINAYADGFSRRVDFVFYSTLPLPSLPQDLALASRLMHGDEAEEGHGLLGALALTGPSSNSTRSSSSSSGRTSSGGDNSSNGDSSTHAATAAGKHSAEGVVEPEDDVDVAVDVARPGELSPVSKHASPLSPDALSTDALPSPDALPSSAATSAAAAGAVGMSAPSPHITLVDNPGQGVRKRKGGGAGGGAPGGGGLLHLHDHRTHNPSRSGVVDGGVGGVSGAGGLSRLATSTRFAGQSPLGSMCSQLTRPNPAGIAWDVALTHIAFNNPYDRAAAMSMLSSVSRARATVAAIVSRLSAMATAPASPSTSSPPSSGPPSPTVTSSSSTSSSSSSSSSGLSTSTATTPSSAASPSLSAKKSTAAVRGRVRSSSGASAATSTSTSTSVVTSTSSPTPSAPFSQATAQALLKTSYWLSDHSGLAASFRLDLTSSAPALSPAVRVRRWSTVGQPLDLDLTIDQREVLTNALDAIKVGTADALDRKRIHRAQTFLGLCLLLSLVLLGGASMMSPWWLVAVLPLVSVFVVVQFFLDRMFGNEEHNALQAVCNAMLLRLQVAPVVTDDLATATATVAATASAAAAAGDGSSKVDLSLSPSSPSSASAASPPSNPSSASRPIVGSPESTARRLLAASAPASASLTVSPGKGGKR